MWIASTVTAVIVTQRSRKSTKRRIGKTASLRKEAHEALQGAARARTEAEVRERIAAINEKIRDAIRMGIRGPALNLVPFDVERIVKRWRGEREPSDP